MITAFILGQFYFFHLCLKGFESLSQETTKVLNEENVLDTSVVILVYK